MTSESNLDDLWAVQLGDLPPKPLLTSLRQNLSSHTLLTTTLSEFLTARSTIEAEYVKSLNKLVGKFGGADIGRATGIEGKGAAQGGNLGELKGTGVGSVWERVVGETVDTAQAHSALSQSLTSSFSDPLRNLPSKLPQWTRLPTLDANVDRTLKTYESALKALEKAEKKDKPSGPRSAKTIAAQSDLDSARESLAIELPGLCRDYQNLQAAQSKWLKEWLIRWETGRADGGNEQAKRAERGMEGALGWEWEEDVKKIVGRLGGGASASAGGKGGQGRGTPSRTPSIRRPTMDSQNRPPSERRHPHPDRTNSLSASDFASGLPPPITSSVSTGSSTGFGSSGGGGGGGGNSLTSTLKSRFGRKSSMIVPSGSSRLEGFGNGNGRSGENGNANANANGNGYRDRSASDASTLRSGVGGVTGRVIGGRGNGGGFESLDGTEEVLTGSRGEGIKSAPVDSEGFSVRPQDAEQAPWERPSNGPRDLLGEDDDDEADSISALPSPAINAGPPKLNLSLAPLPIHETDAERQAALDKMQSTLLTRPPSAPKRQSTIARGRRDVRNTTFNALPDDMPLAQAMRERGIEQDNGPIPGTPERQMSVLPSTRAGFTDSPVMSSPVGSMTNFSSPPPNNRQDSTASVGSGMNPFDARPGVTGGSGLRASITESVNIVTRGGLVQKAMITGEVTLSLRDVGGRSNDSTIHIKLNEFEQLEKVAPNPKFLAQYPDRPGEYYLNLESLAQATASSNSQPVLFKYQLHIPEGKAGDYAPIEMNPQWKTMEGETRLVLNYKANMEGHLGRQLLQAAASTGFDNSGRRVSELSFLAGLGGPSVTNVQAKPPGGTWSPERRKMLWKVDDLEFDASSAGSAGKIVARFLTEGTEAGVPEGVIVRWRCDGTLTSGLGIVVVGEEEDSDAGGWRFEEVKKAVVSGKYMAE